MSKVERRIYVGGIDVENSNPNGSPDTGNAPRMDNQGYGLISPYCMKRGVRDSVLQRHAGEPGLDIFVQEARPLADAATEAHEASAGKDIGVALRERFWDVRAFGAVVSASSTEKKARSIKGPVVFGWAKSADPIDAAEHGIIRCCPSQPKEDKTHNMGSTHVVSYAHYNFVVYVSSFQAEQTGFTDDDLKVLEEALREMFLVRRSQSRPSVEVTSLHRIDVTNECTASDRALVSRIRTVKKDADKDVLEYGDYEVVVDDMPNGASVTTLVG